jgi:hypothetical protein
MIPSIEHLRIQLDELEHRANGEQTGDTRRRILLEVVALERALGATHEPIAIDARELAVIRKRLRRLHGVG